MNYSPLQHAAWDLKDRNIVVTGATKGLGRIAALDFAQSGAQLALLGRDEELLKSLRGELKSPSYSPLLLPGDLTEPENLSRAVEKVLQFFDGRVDSVIHSLGGGLGLHDPLLSEKDLWRLFQLNLGVAAELNRLLVPAMVRSGGGNIVHVGSIASYEGVGSVGYNTVKAGLAAYVRTLGKKLASDKIIVTGILPGGFWGPNNAMDRLQKNKPEVYDKFVSERLPRGKMGLADELVPMLRLLSGPGAAMMSGCMVPMDGGEGNAYYSGF